MAESWLPTDGSSTVIAKKKRNLLKRVAKAASKFQELLSELEEEGLMEDLDYHVDRVLKSHDDEAQSFSQISILAFTQTIEQEASGLASDIDRLWGGGYMAKVIEELMVIWIRNLEGKVVDSEDSGIVRFIAVILEEKSHDKIRHQVKRSVAYDWYRNRQLPPSTLDP